MMARTVWVNLLGKWTDITEDGMIAGIDPLEYIITSEKDLSAHDQPKGFVDIMYQDIGYLIHVSQIQVMSDP